MSNQATAPEAQPKPKSTDPEAVRRVLSVREPVQSAKSEDAPTVTAPKPAAR